MNMLFWSSFILCPGMALKHASSMMLCSVPVLASASTLKTLLLRSLQSWLSNVTIGCMLLLLTWKHQSCCDCMAFVLTADGVGLSVPFFPCSALFFLKHTTVLWLFTLQKSQCRFFESQYLFWWLSPHLLHCCFLGWSFVGCPPTKPTRDSPRMTSLR